MGLKEIVEAAVATFGYVISFVGIQAYAGPFIQKQPWVFILAGLLLIVFHRQIVGVVVK